MSIVIQRSGSRRKGCKTAANVAPHPGGGPHPGAGLSQNAAARAGAGRHYAAGRGQRSGHEPHEPDPSLRLGGGIADGVDARNGERADGDDRVGRHPAARRSGRCARFCGYRVRCLRQGRGRAAGRVDRPVRRVRSPGAGRARSSAIMFATSNAAHTAPPKTCTSGSRPPPCW